MTITIRLNPQVRDTAERAGWTFVQTFAASFSLSPVWSVTALHAAALAGVAAAMALITRGVDAWAETYEAKPVSYGKDLLWRVLSTATQAYVSTWVLMGVFDRDAAQASGMAALAAVLALAKGLAARFVGDPHTAALLRVKPADPQPALGNGPEGSRE